MRTAHFRSLFITLLFLGCKADPNTIESSTFTDGQEPASNKTIVNFLALGDSYTIGEGVDENERWPNQLKDSLMAYWDPKVKIDFVAQTGMTTAELNAAMTNAQLLDSYDFISIQIGVNDQFRGYAVEEFRDELSILIQTALNLNLQNKKGIILLSIPDWGATPFGINYDRSQVSAEIDEFNRIIRAQADALNIKFINITTISRQDANDQTLVTVDGLHPSSKMYSYWVEEVLKEIKNLY